MALTFFLTVIEWVFFRAENISHALQYIGDMMSLDLFSIPEYSLRKDMYPIGLLLVFFILVEWFGRKGQFAIEFLQHKKTRPLKWAFYTLIIFLIGMYMETDETPFIYFQF
jgi:hypothetical protein